MGRHVLARPRTIRNVATAVGVAAALVGTLGPLGGPAGAAVPAPEAVLEAPTRTISLVYPVVAGRTGFAYRTAGGAGYQWTDYASGATSELHLKDNYVQPVNTMSDVIAYPVTAGAVNLVDAPGGTTRTVQLPAGFRYLTVHGETVVAAATTGDATGECHLFRFDGPVLTDRKVVGLPSGAVCTAAFTSVYGVGDPSSTVVGYTLGTVRHYGLVDLDEATFTELPFTGAPKDLQVTKDSVSWFEASKSVKVLSRADLQAAPRSVPIVGPVSNSYVKTFLVGDQVVWANGGGGALTAIAPDGKTTTLLSYAYADHALSGPDGSLLVLGKDPSGDYAVHRFTAGPDGAPLRSEVLTVPWQPSRSARLALNGNRLVTYETDPTGAGLGFFERQPALTGTPTVSGQTYLGPASVQYSAVCKDVQSCPELYPAADGSAVYTTLEDNGYRIHVVDKDDPAPGSQVTVGTAAPKVYGVSGHYIAYGTGTGTAARTEVRDLDSLAVVRTAPAGASALWGNTLWQLSATGKLTATDVAKGTVTRTLTTGASCAAPALQASARYLYWECGAAPTAAGVVDLADGRARTIGVGVTPGRLGDGFVSRLDADDRVVVTDLTGASPADLVMGTANSSVPGAGWTADPHSGLVAYAGKDQKVHLAPTGIGSAPLAQIDSSVPATKNVDDEGRRWTPKWWLSKAAASWKLSLKNKATGITVATLSGGETGGLIEASWDGVPSAGHPVANGAYTWTLTAQPADGSGAPLTKSGTVQVTGGGAVQRDYTGDGIGDVLTLNSKGQFTFQHGDGTGKLSGKTSGSGWSTSAVAVPFGDLNDDHCNDVLVRMTDGSLRGYKPACGKAVTPTTSYTKLGTGFQAYKTLTTAGDLTGDGRADLLGWKTSTGDLYLFATKSDGTMAAGKKIRSHWTYTKVMGVGDLNGDGYGDLLAKDKSNELWRYNGTASGQFKERVLVFKDWGASYNTVVGVGDITGDGKADIVERDGSGNLYRNNGDGKGSFGSRTKIATGWQGYKGIF
ncbi:FG-GAP-like repeat-containing protein [Streptomyces sp. NBC_00353]|uniref:FG-GAP-like repeat-containing protein n=1 Tax=Streptomyces sp. NBC_00353 TaxID=2975722 RepID=UPI002E26EBE8